MPNSACPGAARAGEGDARALGPAQRQLHGALGLLLLGRQFDALVELHLDVGAEQALDLDRPLRRQHVAAAVDVRGKAHALLAHLADLGERHHLEAAAVGEDRAVPAHEGMQAAEAGDALGAGAQHQVIGVGEDDVGAGRLHLVEVERLDGGGGADRHERRRADEPMRRRHRAAARGTVLRQELEPKPRHAFLHRRSLARASVIPEAAAHAEAIRDPANEQS